MIFWHLLGAKIVIHKQFGNVIPTLTGTPQKGSLEVCAFLAGVPLPHAGVNTRTFPSPLDFYYNSVVINDSSRKAFVGCAAER